MILTRKIALGVAGVAAAGVLGTAGVAAATSNNSTPAPSASAAPSSSAAPGDRADHRKAKRAGRALVGRGMHGEWVVKGKDGKTAFDLATDNPIRDKLRAQQSQSPAR